MCTYIEIVGDFNLIRSPKDRSTNGGDSYNMLLFNTLIHAHDLEETHLKGRAFRWNAK
jgi:hypothetical protein